MRSLHHLLRLRQYLQVLKVLAWTRLKLEKQVYLTLLPHRWRDLFSSNRSISTCLKLMHFLNFNVIQSCPLLAEDLDHSCDDWKLCVVSYVSGKFFGYRALNNIIGNTWKCEATLTIHESGWLVYKFQNEEEKFSVLCGDPYLVYGRPLILRSMTECFDFSCSEMTQVPV